MENTTGPTLVENLPVQADVIFIDGKGKRSKSLEKHQTKLLRKMFFLKLFLDENESIQLVTKATSPYSVWEFLMTGQLIFLLKQCYLVFTNKRILHVPLDSSLSANYKNSIAVIQYGDCESIEFKGVFPALLFKYRNGTSEKFRQVQFRDRKKLAAFSGTLPKTGPASAARARYHVCPSCKSPLEAEQEACPSCKLEFKTRAKGRRLALLLPGGGYFYTGHKFLGIVDAITEVILIAFAIGYLIASMGDSQAVPLFVFWSVLVAIEKWVSLFHAKHFLKEFLPADVREIRISG